MSNLHVDESKVQRAEIKRVGVLLAVRREENRREPFSKQKVWIGFLSLHGSVPNDGGWNYI